MFNEMKPAEKELMQSIEDILNDYSIPKKNKGEHVRKTFDHFYLKLETKEDLLMQEMKYDKGGLDLKLGGKTALNFMHCLVDLFKVNGGKNFLTITFKQGENNYGITIQNCNGVETPAERMQRQEDQIKNLEMKLAGIDRYIFHTDEIQREIIQKIIHE